MPRRGTHFTKTKKFTRTCKGCSQEFKAADWKAGWCETCLSPVLCECGCGGTAKSRRRPYIRGHAGRVNSLANAIGHASQAEKIRGDKNPSKRNRGLLAVAGKRYWSSLTPDQKKKRIANSRFVKGTPPSKYRRIDGYRSILEKQVATILDDASIPFHYEPGRKFSDGRRFYPDFVVGTADGPVLIEVSGFAYETWRKLFVGKIEKIKDSGYNVICLTYDQFADDLRNRVSVPVFTLKELQTCLQTIPLELERPRVPGRSSSIRDTGS